MWFLPALLFLLCFRLIWTAIGLFWICFVREEQPNDQLTEYVLFPEILAAHMVARGWQEAKVWWSKLQNRIRQRRGGQ